MISQRDEEHIEEGMVMVQANLDDMNPEWCAYVTDLLLASGANDVYWIPIIMKKGRPGVMLNVLIQESSLREIESLIFTETTTLGIRYLRASCHRLAREFQAVDTPWGPMSVKVGYHQGTLVQFAPEFKECEQVALSHGIPLKQVYDAVRQSFLERQKAASAP